MVPLQQMKNGKVVIMGYGWLRLVGWGLTALSAQKQCHKKLKFVKDVYL